ncbi:MAG: alpha-N-arabinofuranosidase, partial [Prolixibacteraceae bacterium]|nr:alpha-N-arabinofuranosidase [Prolixibacteraceae bacterium]
LVQGLSLHHYTLPTGNWGNKGSSTEFGEELWFKTLKNTMHIEELIEKHLEIMDKYDPRGRVSLIVDEWGTWYDPLPGTNPGFLQQQNSVRDAVLAGINLNIFNNHADRISMANIAQIVNVLQAMILTDGPEMVKTPTYHVFKMYNVHQDATLIPGDLLTEYYEYEGEKIPALTSSASIRDGVTNITLSNANPNIAIELECYVGDKYYESVSGQVVTSEKINDYNDFGKEEKVSIEDFEVNKPEDGKMLVEIPAHSVVLLQLQ